MDDNQYKTIEAQALQIVGTLNKLKEEIEGYRDAKIETQKSLESLDALLSAVSDAAKQLSAAAKEIRKSDYAKLHKEMSKEVETLSSACETMQKSLDDVPEKIESTLKAQRAEQVERDEELYARIASLEEVISRIDRNTQKGFGKERG